MCLSIWKNYNIFGIVVIDSNFEIQQRALQALERAAASWAPAPAVDKLNYKIYFKTMFPLQTTIFHEINDETLDFQLKHSFYPSVVLT